MQPTGHLEIQLLIIPVLYLVVIVNLNVTLQRWGSDHLALVCELALARSGD